MTEKYKHGFKMIKPDSQHDNIEDTIFDSGLPVNSLAMLNRLKQLIEENKTNSLNAPKCKNDNRIRRLMWLLNSQFYGQLETINLMTEWQKLKEECTNE